MTYDNYSILVVDDDEDLRQQMVFWLSSKGFRVMEADSERRALDYIEEGGFDLAILDLMMENMDSGFVLSHRVKQKDKKIPVIIVTGVTKETGLQFDATVKESRDWIKADAFLNKDVRFEQLEGEIQRLLNLGDHQL